MVEENAYLNCGSVFILQDAKKDESVRKSYKYLAALHEVKYNENI